MWEKNLNQKLLLIGGITLLGIWLIYPPSEKLRPGLDIAGGVSLIFEIDDTGITGQANLAEDMKSLLQKRVDPKGVYDLAWRVLGRNRLEVQMPLPPPVAKERRREYADALRDLFAANISRGDMEHAFSLSGAERGRALSELARGSAERATLLEKAAQAYDAYNAALEAYRKGPTSAPASQAAADPPGTSQPATASAPAKTQVDLEDDLNMAEDALDSAYDACLATNLNQARFQEILEMDEKSPTRKNYLDDFMDKKYPELKPQIKRAVAAYAEWRKTRGYLDGPADLQRLLRGAGVLEFRILAEPAPENPTKYEQLRVQLHERGPTPAAGDEYGWFRVDNPLAFFDLKTPDDLARFDPRASRNVVEKRDNDYYVLAKLGAEDGLLATNRNWQLKGASIGHDQRGGYCVNFELDVVGGGLFEELTRKNIGKPLCILVDNVAYSAPNIRSKIRSQGQITGDFSLEKVQYLVQTMQAGSLPARLRETPISERTIGSSLGQTNRDMALRSGVIGLIGVALFMAVYYLFTGMIADAAMMLNIVLVLAIMAVLQARLTLPGIAGIILTIGMSVDANVLINERMREEKERGATLRMIIKNGYDKAFSVILDSNLTTILTCVILYYVGSEEVKGFGLTLGWGIAISMFTALFVTRTIFSLLVKYNLIKDIHMLKLIGVPKIDWYRLRKIFIPLSIVVTLGGLALFLARGRENLLDVEFQGGVSAEVEVKPPAPGEQPLDDVQIARLLQKAADGIGADGVKLTEAQVAEIPDNPGLFRVQVPGVDPERLRAMLLEPLEEAKLLRRGGLEVNHEDMSLTVRAASEVTGEQLQTFIRGQQSTAQAAAASIGRASVGSVVEATLGGQAGRFWSVTTTAQNMHLVQNALEAALGDHLQRRQKIEYVFRGDANGRPFPIRADRLGNVMPGVELPAAVAAESIGEYRDGAAMLFENLRPPQCVDPQVPGSLADQLRITRLQPGFQELPFRKFKVIGVQPAGTDSEGHPLYSSAVVVVVDDSIRYSDNPERWYSGFAQREQQLASTALESEQTLRRVSQFKPQIAERASTQAVLAVVLSWVMIVSYMWLRFGRAAYGLAGVVGLVHDVLVGLAALGIAGWVVALAPHLSRALLIEDFKINMTTVAAILTIIGYSINDTIVVFDRIRETRGRLGRVTPQVINDSINQTLSRTILTAGTVWIVVFVMYVFGGSSIRGFNFCMLAGTITGCYSSIAICSPLLLVRLHRRAEPALA